MLGVFGVPAARDDDSLRAVTAGVALRSSGLVSRVGLSTGEVVTGDPLVAGAPVDEAARLQERAGAGDVLASARTWRAVRHAVEATPRDDAWAVDTVDPDAAPLVRRLETPLVGRDRSCARSPDEFECAAGEGRPRLITVFGAPGWASHASRSSASSGYRAWRTRPSRAAEPTGATPRTSRFAAC